MLHDRDSISTTDKVSGLRPKRRETGKFGPVIAGTTQSAL